MISLIRRMHKPQVVTAVLCMLVVTAGSYFELKLPDYMSSLTLLIQAGAEDVSAILSIGLEMLLVVVMSALLTVASGYLSARTAAGFTKTLREELFLHITGFDQENMLGFSVPSLITRTTTDIMQVQNFTSAGLGLCVKAPTMAIWAVIKILSRSTELSLITMVFVVALCLLQFMIVSHVIPRIRIIQKLTDAINRVARENISGINVVHAFNAEEYEEKKFDGVNSEMMSLQLKNQRLFAIMGPSMGLAMSGLSLCIYWVGAAMLSGMADTAERIEFFSNVVVFSSYATHVVISFSFLVMIFMMYPMAQVSAERINAVFSAQTKIREGAETAGDGSGTLEFRDVSFRYPDAAEDALQHISFKVKKGETLAIIGSTGCGKTSLVNLITRFYDATGGEVLLDGVSVQDYSFEGLYNKIGYIAQKAVLFSGSIRENLSFGKKDGEFTEEDIRAAVDTAQAAEFVDKSEGGLDYTLAQAGKNLSGGQKQRLSIARALARTPEVLIFDDSFSALDYRTDADLRSALAKNFADTIRVIVAQRIGTIRNAEQILVLDEGKCVGLGTHSELMKSCRIYQEIARSQLSAAELM
ncbi:MAG: ABC transporter ATP-binding protein [Lachnospiraceae bacterium]|nr:ABC transporter ATP-binding protein [Lachnospiraceae bacterium]